MNERIDIEEVDDDEEEVFCQSCGEVLTDAHATDGDFCDDCEEEDADDEVDENLNRAEDHNLAIECEDYRAN